ncbi:HAD hydrolase family protein [bacterium]|jgi:3-deoxy-D-manno-octulosonate 8-phosphate phosphatase (KDO 8-P phosphatase)|nr:HAD hydrolase family protein [bacterium]
MRKSISIEQIDAFIFDFDGVLTNNLVYIDENSKEAVRCSRSDGLAFDVLRKIEKPVYILSTEKNPVVSARAKKMQVPVIQGVGDKVLTLSRLAKDKSYTMSKLLYVGNDLNDYYAMKLCGFSACPIDSHKKIKKIATFVLNTEGGSGVVRELVEEIIGLDFLKTLYP